jgi:hypothetical protein
MLDFKSLIPTFSQREKELFEFLEIPLMPNHISNIVSYV